MMDKGQKAKRSNVNAMNLSQYSQSLWNLCCSLFPEKHNFTEIDQEEQKDRTNLLLEPRDYRLN